MFLWHLNFAHDITMSFDLELGFLKSNFEIAVFQDVADLFPYFSAGGIPDYFTDSLINWPTGIGVVETMPIDAIEFEN